VQIAPGINQANRGRQRNHDVVPTVMVYQSAVRNGDGEFTSGQPMEDR
jgi:hypothetical protein